MIQEYGINVMGDIFGGMLILFLFIIFGGPEQRRAWYLVIGATILSCWGSITVWLPAISKGDTGIAAYHFVWILATYPMLRYCFWRLRIIQEAEEIGR